MFFQNDNIWKKWDIIPSKTAFLLACSGGKDSMALLHFFIHQGCNFAVAHCNFGLRGADSDGDELFLKHYCQENNILIFNTSFETATFAEDNKIAIQEAARNLRYGWLEKIRLENNFHYIVTAHHANDQAETILFHLAKGTGLKGLIGMDGLNGKILRPLLNTSVLEIFDYIEKHQVPFREDISNESDKYSRNFIRHNIIPLMEKLNPNFIATMSGFSQRMDENYALAKSASLQLWKKQATENEKIIKVVTGVLKNHPARSTILFYWLEKFGFSSQQIIDIESAIKLSKNGLQFTSNSHVLFVENRHFLIADKKTKQLPIKLVETWPNQIVFNNLTIKVSKIPMAEVNIKKSERYAYFDADKLDLPLKIRYLQTGDYFYPFGMSKYNSIEKLGKKKVSKFFKDIKLQNYTRTQTPILLSDDKIIWVVGHRIDGRFAISKNTKSVIKMVVVDDVEK
jgi:tRNA(Ile)-lysidine synthase